MAPQRVPVATWFDSAAARLARRDLRAHRGRSLLIAVLVMLPVVFVVAGVTVVASNVATRDEAATRALGLAQARLTRLPSEPDGRSCDQHPLALGSQGCGESDQSFHPIDVPARLVDAAPPGYRTIGVRGGAIEALKPVAGASALPRRVPVTVVDIAEPAFAGRWDLVAGRAASGTEVVVSRPWLSVFGARLGDDVITADGRYRIAGVVAAPGLKDPMLYVPTGHPVAAATEESEVYLIGERAIPWQEVRQLNRRGVTALSRAVVLNPPSGVWADDSQGRSTVVVSLAGALGGLLLMFVAGSAFAVGVRSSRRQLGLLGAVGADARVLRRIVLGQALLLGGGGAAAGAGLGVLWGMGIAWWLRETDTASVWGFHVAWLPTLVAAGVGVCAAVAAAWNPARTVTKVDALEAVRSAEVTMPPAVFPWLGVGALLVGLAAQAASVALWQAGDPASPYARPELVLIALAGMVLLVAGVALSLQRVVACLGTWVPRRPLALRLAVRELDRSRGRVVPGVAAVLTAATLATVVMGLNAGMLAQDRAQRAWRILPTQALVTLHHGRDPAVPVAVIERVLGPVAATAVLGAGHAGLDIPEPNRCPGTREGTRPIPGADWRCDFSQAGNYPTLAIGGARELALLLGREPRSDELVALASGIVVTNDRHRVLDDHAVLLRWSPQGGDGTADALPELSVSAKLVATDGPVGWALVSPARAQELHVTQASPQLLVSLTRTPTAAELDRVEAGLRDLDITDFVLPRDPNRPDAPLGWMAVGIAGLMVLAVVGLTTALGVADARRDDATLASLGASRGLRRASTAAQVLVVATLGSALGAGIGLLTLLALTHSQPSYGNLPIAVPWVELLGLVLGVPLIGAAGAWLVTRSGQVMARRAT